MRHLTGFPGSSAGQESTSNAGDLGSVRGWGWSPWRREWQPTPVFLPGESRGQRSLVRYSPWGHKESDTTKRLKHTHTRGILQFWVSNHLVGHLPSALVRNQAPGVLHITFHRKGEKNIDSFTLQIQYQSQSWISKTIPKEQKYVRGKS